MNDFKFYDPITIDCVTSIPCVLSRLIYTYFHVSAFFFTINLINIFLQRYNLKIKSFP